MPTNNPPTNQDVKTVDGILDDYYMPIKLPDNNREGLKQALLTLLDNQVIGEDEPEQFGLMTWYENMAQDDMLRKERNSLREQQRQALYQAFNITPPSKER